MAIVSILRAASIYGAKSAIVLVFLYFGFRLLGKRELGQMNVYDLAMIVCISNAVQNAMTGGQGRLIVGVASSTALILVAAGINRAAARSPRTYKLLVGSPTVLLSQGRIIERRLRLAHVSDEELSAAIREHGLTDPSQVSLAVLEVDGSLSIVPKNEKKAPKSK